MDIWIVNSLYFCCTAHPKKALSHFSRFDRFETTPLEFPAIRTDGLPVVAAPVAAVIDIAAVIAARVITAGIVAAVVIAIVTRVV